MGRKFLLVLVVVALVGGGVGGAYWISTIQVRNTFREANDLLGKGDLQQANDLFEKVYHKRPHSPEGYGALGNLCRLSYSLEQPDKTLEYAQEFLNRSTQDADKATAMYYLGCALSKQEKSSEAAAQWAQVLQQYPAASVADDAMLATARLKAKEGKSLEAQEMLKALIAQFPDSDLQQEAYAELGRANVKLLFSPAITPSSVQITVKSGDTVEGLAKKYGTTADVVRESNGLGKGSMLRKGQLIKIDKNKYSIVVSKSQNTLTLLADGEFFKRYSVGTGKENSTPVGEYKVTNKLVNPPWYKPGGGLVPFGDKGNLLGTRWIGINLPGYGIHGTWEPDTVGKQSSAGCVRLMNEEVEELFKIIPVGTKVTIED